VQTVTVRAGDRGCGEERCKLPTRLARLGAAEATSSTGAAASASLSDGETDQQGGMMMAPGECNGARAAGGLLATATDGVC